MPLTTRRLRISYPFISRAVDAANLRAIITQRWADLVDARIKEVIQPPLVTYWYGQTLGAQVLNFGQTASTPNIVSKAKKLCVCKMPRLAGFIDKDLGHVCTNKTDFIISDRLRKLLSCNLKFRSTGAPTSVFTNTGDEENTYFQDRTRSQLTKFATDAGDSFGFGMEYFEAFTDKCVSDITTYVPEIIAGETELKEYQLDDEATAELEWIQRHFVITTTDKNENRAAFICKHLYCDTAQTKLDRNDAYRPVTDETPEAIITRLNDRATSHGLATTLKEDENFNLPKHRLTAKMHKEPTAFRPIAASRKTPITHLAITVATALRLILKEMDTIWRQQFLQHTGRIPPRSAILSSTHHFSLHLRAIRTVLFQPNSPLASITGFQSDDFNSLYTEIPHTAAGERLPQIIHLAFKAKTAQAHTNHRRPPNFIFIPTNSKYGRWATDKDPEADGTYLSAQLLSELIHFILANIFITFGGKTYQQTRGFPMGLNCCVELAVSFLFSYELPFALRQLNLFSQSIATRHTRSALHTSLALSNPLPPILLVLFFFIRYIDDLFYPILRDLHLTDYMYDRRSEGGTDGIYPTSLLGPNGVIDMPLALSTSSTGLEVNMLDITAILRLNINPEGPHSLHYKLFDKRKNNPKFALTMAFPPMDSILADPSKYSVLRSQMFRFDRNCSFASDFIMNTTELATSMISQGYNRRRLTQQVRKYARKWDTNKGRWPDIKRKVISAVYARSRAINTNKRPLHTPT